MDPDKAFKDFIDAVCDDDPQEAWGALESLLSWYQKGGARIQFPQMEVSKLFLENMKTWAIQATDMRPNG